MLTRRRSFGRCAARVVDPLFVQPPARSPPPATPLPGAVEAHGIVGPHDGTRRVRRRRRQASHPPRPWKSPRRPRPRRRRRRPWKSCCCFPREAGVRWRRSPSGACAGPPSPPPTRTQCGDPPRRRRATRRVSWPQNLCREGFYAPRAQPLSKVLIHSPHHDSRVSRRL